MLYRGLDNAIKEGTGKGFENFTTSPPGNDGELSDKPLLCLHFDECSSNLGMFLFMLYTLPLRLVAFRDLFHREWNDIKLALQAAGVWHAVLLSTLIFRR